MISPHAVHEPRKRRALRYRLTSGGPRKSAHKWCQGRRNRFRQLGGGLHAPAPSEANILVDLNEERLVARGYVPRAAKIDMDEFAVFDLQREEIDLLDAVRYDQKPHELKSDSLPGRTVLARLTRQKLRNR